LVPAGRDEEKSSGFACRIANGWIEVAATRSIAETSITERRRPAVECLWDRRCADGSFRAVDWRRRKSAFELLVDAPKRTGRTAVMGQDFPFGYRPLSGFRPISFDSRPPDYSTYVLISSRGGSMSAAPEQPFVIDATDEEINAVVAEFGSLYNQAIRELLQDLYAARPTLTRRCYAGILKLRAFHFNFDASTIWELITASDKGYLSDACLLTGQARDVLLPHHSPPRALILRRAVLPRALGDDPETAVRQRLLKRHGLGRDARSQTSTSSARRAVNSASYGMRHAMRLRLFQALDRVRRLRRRQPCSSEASPLGMRRI